MARQRAGVANKAFSKVGTAEVPESVDAGITASDNKDMNASVTNSDTADDTAIKSASRKPRATAGRKPRRKASVKASENPAEPRVPRRGVPLGRPAGPARVPLSVRILAETETRLIATMAKTGETPQNLVERLLLAEADRLGIPAGEK